MADDAADVKDGEITLDDFNGDEADPKAESSTADKKEASTKAEEKKEAEVEAPAKPDVETKADKDTEGKDDSKADDTAEPPAEETPEADDTAKEDPSKPKDAESRKAQLNTEIRDLVAQRNALKDEVTKANAEVYAPATIDELKEQGLSETDAKVESLRQQVEMDKYNTAVAEAQLTIESESQRVLADYPMFNPESKEYDKELAEEAADLLRSNLLIDENSGQVIGSNLSPYKLYSTLARASTTSAAKGHASGREATEKMLANADVSTNAAPPKTKSDPLMDLWTSDD